MDELGTEQKEGAWAVVGRHLADRKSPLRPFAKFLRGRVLAVCDVAVERS
jgi:hypothetical protein